MTTVAFSATAFPLDLCSFGDMPLFAAAGVILLLLLVIPTFAATLCTCADVRPDRP